MTDEREAFNDRLPETYEVPPDLIEHWRGIDSLAVLPWTKGAIDALQYAIDQICMATVQGAALSSAAYRNDLAGFEAAYEKLGIAAIKGQNALRGAVAELAAVHRAVDQGVDLSSIPSDFGDLHE